MVTFGDASGAGVSQTMIGAKAYGVGDSDNADASNAGTLTTDSVAYDKWECLDGGGVWPRMFVDYDPPALPSRHRFRARLAELVPAASSNAVTFTFQMSAYFGASSPTVVVRVYSFYVGSVTSPEFCACMAGTWDGSACLGI
jgi:hypothetical protein